MRLQPVYWLLFILLALIWGSSFILMKEGLTGLTAIQVASIRIISSGMVLLPVVFKAFKQIPRNKLWVVFLSGSLGSLLPAYLFCIAEETVDSALAGSLNSLTPIFVIIIGTLFFSVKTSTEKIFGIIIAFTGSVLLFFSQDMPDAYGNLSGIILIVLATVMYGINVNLVQRYLQHINSVSVVAVALLLNAIPAFIVLYSSGYFSAISGNKPMLISTGYSLVLGIIGTALASVLFYSLIKKAGAVFSSMVTYLIPVVANLWGLWYGEDVGWKQFTCLAVILLGVYIAARLKLPNALKIQR